MVNSTLTKAARYRRTLEYKEELEDTELFYQHYVNFDDIDREFFNSYVHLGVTLDIGNIISLEKTHLTGIMAAWCKENKITYKKIKIDSFKITDANGNPVNWGQTQYGLYFYSTEDAVAFKLRWC